MNLSGFGFHILGFFIVICRFSLWVASTTSETAPNLVRQRRISVFTSSVSLNPKCLKKKVMGKTRHAKHILLRAHINWHNPWDRVAAYIRQKMPTRGHTSVPHRATSAPGVRKTTIYVVWMGFFFFSRTLKCFGGISKYHHFRFTSAPGVIFVEASPTAEEERISLLKPIECLDILSTNVSNVLNPGGLNAERKLYLYRHVRPFCSDQYIDIICPQIN